MTQIFPANQRRCASSAKNVAILTLCSKRAIISPNNLIDSQHHKHHRKIRKREFHSPSLCILIIMQSKVSLYVNNFKLLQNDLETDRIFSQPPLISFKRDKNSNPALSNARAHDANLVLSLLNTSKISGP